MNLLKPSTALQHKEFNEESDEYYPPACCEILHVTNAVYMATFLQIIFVVTISILYHFLERNAFVSAIEIFRPAVGFIICINVIGILLALIGVILQQGLLISAQIALLAGLVIISDIIALALIIAMASSGWNSNQKIYEIGAIGANTFPSIYFVDERKFESILGPFWVYLTAIIFHMCAAVTMCIIGVYRRYAKFLKDKFNYSRVHSYERGENSNRRDSVGPNLLRFN